MPNIDESGLKLLRNVPIVLFELSPDVTPEDRRLFEQAIQDLQSLVRVPKATAMLDYRLVASPSSYRRPILSPFKRLSLAKKSERQEQQRHALEKKKGRKNNWSHLAEADAILKKIKRLALRKKKHNTGVKP